MVDASETRQLGSRCVLREANMEIPNMQLRVAEHVHSVDKDRLWRQVWHVCRTGWLSDVVGDLTV